MCLELVLEEEVIDLIEVNISSYVCGIFLEAIEISNNYYNNNFLAC